MSQHDLDAQTIAIIGMSGRFPGAPDLDQFWQNLAGQVESISFFKTAELDPLVREKIGRAHV